MFFSLTVVAVPGFVAESPGASNLEQLLHPASVSGPSGIYSPQKTKGTASFDKSRYINRFYKTSKVLYYSVYWDNYNQHIYHSGGCIKAFRGKLRTFKMSFFSQLWTMDAELCWLFWFVSLLFSGQEGCPSRSEHYSERELLYDPGRDGPALPPSGLNDRQVLYPGYRAMRR